MFISELEAKPENKDLYLNQKICEEMEAQEMVTAGSKLNEIWEVR